MGSKHCKPSKYRRGSMQCTEKEALPISGEDAEAPSATDVKSKPICGCEEFPLKYRMDNPKRGRFIIISNKTFQPKTRMSIRTGTDADVANLERAFKGLDFEVETHTDLTIAKMLQLMIKESDRDHKDCDCFGVAFLSHGVDGQLYGTDDLIDIDSLLAPFKGCLTLAGKPKLFFFQACRGDKFDAGMMVQADSPGGSKDQPAETQIRLPLESDFLYAYSTVPGYYSWRNDNKGSWFVQALSNKLGEMATKNIDLVRILTRVSHQVAHDFKSSCSDWSLRGMKQVPSVVSMLTKDLYFTPKNSAKVGAVVQ